jgi:hypothetical protein
MLHKQLLEDQESKLNSQVQELLPNKQLEDQELKQI